MTNKQLIEFLQTYPLDSEIFIADYDGACENPRKQCIFLNEPDSIEFYKNNKKNQKLIRKRYIIGDIHRAIGNNVIVLH